MARSRTAPSISVAIASGKGGVGKSNVAVNLSICLASKGLRVTLVDMDMGLANADLLMNLHPRYTLAHVLSGARSLDQVCMNGPGGVRFIPGASGLQSTADLTEFERRNLITQLHKLETSTDIIVLDCGAGIGRNVISFALAADRVVVVTTPQPTALADAYAVIKTLHRERCGTGFQPVDSPAGYQCHIGLFVNMVNSRGEAIEAYQRIAKVAHRFLNYSVVQYGYMLHDTTVELAVHQRCPFVIAYPGSNAGACIAAMASEMSRTFTEQTRRAGTRGSFFSRVAGLFV